MASNICMPCLASKLDVMKFSMLHHSHTNSRDQLKVCSNLDDIASAVFIVISLVIVFVVSISSYYIWFVRAGESKGDILYDIIVFVLK